VIRLLTADDALSALAACCGEEPEGPAEAVMLVRQSQPSFAATLFSAWQAEGADLDPGLKHDVDVAAARNDRYRAVAAELMRQVPALVPVKGLEVAQLYPPGVVRAMNDIDFIAPGEPELWRAIGFLLDAGWDMHTATFLRVRGTLHILASLRRPHESPYVLPYGVEVATYAALGDLARVPPLVALPAEWRSPAVKNTVMLLFERFEQPYRARDLVDASLLLGPATDDERAGIAAAVARLGLQPEYTELAGLVAGTSLPALPALPGPTGGPARTRLRRLARAGGLLRRPLLGTARHLQRRTIAGTSRWFEHRPWAGVQHRLAVRSALRGGLLAFGLPLDGTPPRGDSAVIHQRSDMCWADTPVGRFLLTIGDDVDEDAMEELSGNSGEAEPDATPDLETTGAQR
jgi:hypothetical protein